MEFFENNWIEIVGAIVGLLYLYFEYKASILMWPAGIVMSLFYVIVFAKATFYAFACINIYYIIIAVYGWIQWHKSREEYTNKQIEIVHTPTRLYVPIFIVLILVFTFIIFILNKFTDSHVVIGDSFVTALSIVAMIMLARRYVEQWLLLIVVNIVSIFLYFYQNLYPTSIMYLFYTIVSIFGYLKWKELAKIEKNRNNRDNENISTTLRN